MNIEISKIDNKFSVCILETMDNRICNNIDDIITYILKIDKDKNKDLDIFIKNSVNDNEYNEILNKYNKEGKK